MEDPKPAVPDQTTMASSHVVTKLKTMNKRFVKYQYLAFIMTAVLYSLSHATRTIWGYSKPYIKDDYYTSSRLGIIDFSFMAAYAIGQYLNGWLGDRVNLKLFLLLGLSSAATGLSLFGYLEGILRIQMFYVAILVFVLNGLGQSTVKISKYVI